MPAVLVDGIMTKGKTQALLVGVKGHGDNAVRNTAHVVGMEQIIHFI
jgi:hypothetical protein